MFVWYFKEENTLRFWRLCGRIEKTRRKETAVTLQQLRYVTAVAGTGTISHAVQQFYISQPSLTNAIRELEQEVGLALSKTASSVVSRTLLDARGQMSAKSMHPPAYGQRKCQKKKGVQEKMKHLHKGGWCHPHSTRRLAFCRGCRIRQNTTPAKGALPGRLSPSTAALKTHRPRLRSAAMKAPVGLLSDRTVLRQQDGGAPPRQVRICFSLTNTLPVCYLYSIETASLLTERCGAPQCRAAGMSMPTVWAALRNCCAKLSFFAIKEDV